MAIFNNILKYSNQLSLNHINTSYQERRIHHPNIRKESQMPRKELFWNQVVLKLSNEKERRDITVWRILSLTLFKLYYVIHFHTILFQLLLLTHKWEWRNFFFYLTLSNMEGRSPSFLTFSSLSPKQLCRALCLFLFKLIVRYADEEGRMYISHKNIRLHKCKGKFIQKNCRG